MESVSAERSVEARIRQLRQQFHLERSLEELLSRKLRRRGQCHPDAHGSRFADIRAGLEAFLGDQIAGGFVADNLKRMSGGGSNASYSFTLTRGDTVEQLVLRVKQAGTIETSVSREFQMMEAMYGVLPISRPCWMTEDSGYFGAPALISNLVPGVQAPSSKAIMASGMGVVYGEAAREKLAPQFVRYEARLHSYDWSGKNLSHFDIPRPGTTDAVDWRLSLWDRVWEEDKFEDHPTLLLTKEWLWNNRPIVDHVSVLHGDYRNGNFLYDEKSCEITGILDWELCSLGDRHSDLGYTMLRAWGHVGADGKFLNSGLMDTEAFTREYERESRLCVDPVRLHYYLVLAIYWSAVALIGTGIRNAELGQTQLDVLYHVIAGKGGFDIGELNRLVVRSEP